MRFLRRVPAVGSTITVPVLPAPRTGDAVLPVPGPLRLGDVDLGSGRPVVADPSFAQRPGPRSPALWATDDVVPDAAGAWRRLVDRFPATGLWPLVLGTLDGDDQRPWDAGEIEPVDLADVDALDPARVLAAGWAAAVAVEDEPMPEEDLAPFGSRFPGLAPPLPRSAEVAAVPGTALAPQGAARIGLAACRRPADAVALVGWQGAVNVTGPAELAAVLRSWEDRFGVVLAGLGFDTVTLLVPQPPQDQQHALAVAAEIAALCPDALWQVDDDTFEGMTRSLVRRPVWELWFD